MAIRYAIALTDTERTTLREIISKNKAKRSTIINAYIYSKLIGSVVGPMKILLRHMKYPQKKSSSSRNVLLKKDLKPPYIANQ